MFMFWHPKAPLTALKACRIFLFYDMPLGEMSVLVNSCQDLVFLPILKDVKYTRNPIPCKTALKFCLELYSRPDW